MEREQDGRLPMLDVMLIKNQDRTITTDVYRKETHTDHYLQWSSNHPVQQKLGIVKTLMHRADTLIQDRTLREVEKGKVRTHSVTAAIQTGPLEKVTPEKHSRGTTRTHNVETGDKHPPALLYSLTLKGLQKD
ncbi:PREDICTED: uncharacterized protein LOC109461974 [Branchiostoma belcheri]|uniref:Uncharacterized protein LOC109461974 n=1 Tax=Branchiostoma belcheri TaxID=7741 RepID=A0A6P4XTN8_BRABE|nr:PREDICTED: uncharacterized protein LOC109461974 [Branchiostoma belcheri]